MNIIEHRYAVAEYVVGTIIEDIVGTRSEKTVAVQRTKATGYLARMDVADWDKLAKTPEEARVRWIELHQYKLESAERNLISRREDLRRETNFVASYKVIQQREQVIQQREL